MTKKNIPAHATSKLDRLDTFVLAGVVTILLTRAFLALTGYPQIGSDSLHVAHVLYGGVVLVAAFLFLLLSNKPNLLVAALIGGIGFGLFIDEVGKFVTQDNDYFYEPAIGLMYITFLLIWFIARLIIVRGERLPFLSPAEWPSKKWQKNLVVAFCLVTAIANIVLIPAVIILGFNTVSSALDIPRLGIAASIIYGLFLSHGLWHKRLKHSDRAAHNLRGAAIFSIAAVFPFYYINHPAFSSLTLIPTILVIIALSEVSIMSLLKKLAVKSN